MLVNGSPAEEFRMHRGVWQGYPLAPFIFLCMAEGLVGLMREVVDKNLFLSMKIRRNHMEVDLLQFVDDTLFFAKPSMEHVMTLKTILRCFELVLGLKINFFKSKLAGVAVESATNEIYASLLNCKVMYLPFEYLGIPISANPAKESTWEPIIQKMNRKHNRWKHRNAPFGGRICLLNFVLKSLSLFFLSFSKIPIVVVKKVVRLQIEFLWGKREEGGKIAWVKWNRICWPKEEEGLGVKDIHLFNLALLSKWKWRLFSNEEALRERIIMSKYGEGIKKGKGGGVF